MCRRVGIISDVPGIESMSDEQFVDGSLRSRRLPQDGPGWVTPTPPLRYCNFAIMLRSYGPSGGDKVTAEAAVSCRGGHLYRFCGEWNGESIEIMRCERCASALYLAGRPVELMPCHTML